MKKLILSFVFAAISVQVQGGSPLEIRQIWHPPGTTNTVKILTHQPDDGRVYTIWAADDITQPGRWYRHWSGQGAGSDMTARNLGSAGNAAVWEYTITGKDTDRIFRIEPFLYEGWGIDENLSVGSTGIEVVELQVFLHEQGYLQLSEGVSYGYFGSLTQEALAALQARVGITSDGDGYCGPSTRGYLDRRSNTIGIGPYLMSIDHYYAVNGDGNTLGIFDIDFSMSNLTGDDFYVSKTDLLLEVVREGGGSVFASLAHLSSSDSGWDYPGWYEVDEGDRVYFSLHVVLGPVESAGIYKLVLHGFRWSRNPNETDGALYFFEEPYETDYLLLGDSKG